MAVGNERVGQARLRGGRVFEVVVGDADRAIGRDTDLRRERGRAAGDWSMRITGNQFSPPSVDCENAIFALPVELNRPSCQTA